MSSPIKALPLHLVRDDSSHEAASTEGGSSDEPASKPMDPEPFRFRVEHKKSGRVATLELYAEDLEDAICTADLFFADGCSPDAYRLDLE